MGAKPKKAGTLYSYVVAKREAEQAGTPLVRVLNTHGCGGLFDNGVHELRLFLNFAGDISEVFLAIFIQSLNPMRSGLIIMRG